MAKSGGRGHGEHGEVCSVGEEHGSNGKHVRVTVKHGKRKPAPKGKNAIAPYDDRRETNFTVPREKAHHYPVGTKVRVALHPARKKRTAQDDADEMFGGKAL